MKSGLQAFFTHFFVLVFFVIVAVAYFNPVLRGKVIEQSDIRQYTGMAKEQNDFRKKEGVEPYWTNSAFGGMPTYQLGAYYPHDYVKKLDRLIRFLPRPADYLFLYFLGFYILLCCLKVDYRLAALGALAFGFSTYLIIILGVGHNAKAHALAYMPMLLGGIVLTFRGKYIWGFVLTAIAMALEVGANHYQMTYYFMLLVLIVGAVYLIDALRKKNLRNFIASVGLLIVAVVLGIAANATSLLATKEYADWSTRGKSELTITPDGAAKTNTNGLDKAYITQYSYGISESLNLLVPRLFGGSNAEDLGRNSKTYDFLIDQGISRSQALDFSKHLPLYWGDQPIVAAPAYIGAIVLFLFLLGLLLVKSKAKWWLLGGVIMALLLSWGKNFGLLTDFMIDYFPLYNKFRAVSSIQVIAELCVPILAVLGVGELLDPTVGKGEKLNALKVAFLSILGIGVALFVLKGTFSFEGASDDTLQRYYGDEILSLIRLDRQAVYTNDLLRTLLFVILAALAIWLYVKEKVKSNLLILALGVLIVVDLVGVDLRYVNKDDFVSKRKMAEPFPMTTADQQILQDEGVYRVYSPQEGLNGARTSFYHKSIGGYHAAKPGRLQDLFDFYIYQGKIEILDMLNVKYVIQQNEEGKEVPTMNPNANGNAWFVNRLTEVKSADAEIKALENLDNKHEAVVNTVEFPTIRDFEYQTDALATVTLTDYKPNALTYRSSNANAGVVVFSEMYYKNGWNAYIDGVQKDHFRVNYLLRALEVPAGDHSIVFKFEPEIVRKGSLITLGSSIVLGLIVIGGIVFSLWGSPKKEGDR